VTPGRGQQQVTFRDLLHHLQTERKALLAKKSLSYLPLIVGRSLMVRNLHVTYSSDRKRIA
jgi:hypothetical protein